MSEFSKKMVEAAWERCEGNCECTYITHGHHNRCGKNLLKAYRGDRFNFSGWEAHSKSGQHLDSLADCEILCWDPCYLAIREKEKHTIKENSAII